MSNFISPAIQAMNLVRYIGDEVSRLGEPILTLECTDIQEIIGAPSVDFVQHLIEDLKENGTVKGDFGKAYPYSLFRASLTLDGWKQYEAEKRGKFQSNRGFIAMQFGDSELDPFVKEVVKPAVKEDLGYDLIVDLTHDNPGAYWEAGYAEGLGKPVIYICEKAKFETERTHFDTNHCTTVPWSRDDDEGFKQELTATLRRSLEK